MSVRTYNPSVRVGNWNEDLQLEEDTLKDFLERRERGELLIQRSSNFKNTIGEKVQLSTTRDTFVHYGDNALILNLEPCGTSEHPRKGAAALAVNMSPSALHNATGLNQECGVSGTKEIDPTPRTCFTIASVTGAQNGDPLRYGEPFYLKTTNGDLFLTSDKATFAKCAKKSRHNEVNLVNGVSHLSQWKITAFDPEYRMEMEGAPVPANERVLITHVKTGHHLCLEAQHMQRGAFGMEYEISSFTSLDSHKAERDINHWLITMNKPGDDTMPVTE